VAEKPDFQLDGIAKEMVDDLIRSLLTLEVNLLSLVHDG
jgi:hypothetical protein